MQNVCVGGGSGSGQVKMGVIRWKIRSAERSKKAKVKSCIQIYVLKNDF